MRYASIDRLFAMLGLQDATKCGNKTPEQQRNSYATIMKYEIRDAIEAAECHFEADPNFDEILTYAVMYACGRMSYAPFNVCRYIMPLIGEIETNALRDIVREIDEHERRHPFGLGNPTIDAPQWIALRGEIQLELARREKGDGNEQA